MYNPRQGHAVGIVTDEATQEKLVTVTGGYDFGTYFKSSEILIGDTWSLGEKRWTLIIWSCVEKLPF